MSHFICLVAAEPSAFWTGIASSWAERRVQVLLAPFGELLGLKRPSLVIRDLDWKPDSVTKAQLLEFEDLDVPQILLASPESYENQWAQQNGDLCDVISKPLCDGTLLYQLGMRAVERARKMRDERDYRAHLEKLILDRAEALRIANEERDKLRKNLKQQELESRAALNALPVAVVWVREYEVQRGNRQLAEMLGLPLAQIVGRDERALFANGPAWRRAVRSLEKQIDDRKLARVESQWKREDGELFPVEIWAQLVGDSWRNGAVLCAIDLTVFQRAIPFEPSTAPDPVSFVMSPASKPEQIEVMLISSDIDSHFFARFLLERHGFHVSPFIDAESALISLEGVEGRVVMICDGTPRDMSVERFLAIFDDRCPLYFCGELSGEELPKDCILLKPPLDLRQVADSLIRRFCGDPGENG